MCIYTYTYIYVLYWYHNFTKLAILSEIRVDKGDKTTTRVDIDADELRGMKLFLHRTLLDRTTPIDALYARTL